MFWWQCNSIQANFIVNFLLRNLFSLHYHHGWNFDSVAQWYFCSKCSKLRTISTYFSIKCQSKGIISSGKTSIFFIFRIGLCQYIILFTAENAISMCLLLIHSKLAPYLHWCIIQCALMCCAAIEWRNRFRKKQNIFSIKKKVYAVRFSQFSAFVGKEWNWSRLFLLHWHLKYSIGLHLIRLTWNFPLFHWEFQTNWNPTIKKIKALPVIYFYGIHIICRLILRYESCRQSAHALISMHVLNIWKKAQWRKYNSKHKRNRNWVSKLCTIQNAIS